MAIPPFLIKGNEYSTNELVKEFGGNNHHGIIYCAKTNVVLAISVKEGGPYKDRPDENDPSIFLYHGSGQKGVDQDPESGTNGNKRLTHSVENGSTVYLFEKLKKGAKCKFIDEVRVIGQPYFDPEDAPGSRKLIYRLQYQTGRDIDDLDESVKSIPDDKLKTIVSTIEKRTVTTTQYNRNPYVREYARRRSKGVCDLCEREAPFKKRDGSPYLEVHHIVPLSENGKDSWENVCALCPNCHRKMHIVKDDKDKQKLLKVASVQL